MFAYIAKLKFLQIKRKIKETIWIPGSTIVID